MRAVLAAIGRTLVTLGLLILLFVGYQLWGTGIYQARAQNRLEKEFSDLLGRVAAPSTSPRTSTAPVTTSTTTDGDVTTATAGSIETTTSAPMDIPPIAFGDPIAKIQISAIGLDAIVVQGTSRDDLKNGPGHYPSTPLPGQYGNAAIAGHRTTYGAPFNRLDELKPGDLILTQSVVGESVYEVTETLVVAPTDVGVVANTPDEPWLTLTTCNPEFSARERLVVKAKMGEKQSDPPARPSISAIEGGAHTGTPGDDQALGEGLAGDAGSRGPAALWGALAAFAGLLWLWAFRRWRLPTTWVVGAVPFLAVLFVFYVYLERTLPAGY